MRLGQSSCWTRDHAAGSISNSTIGPQVSTETKGLRGLSIPILTSAGVMKNAMHLLRSINASELTAKQVLALKPWLAKRHQRNNIAQQYKLSESGAALAAIQSPRTSNMDSDGADEHPSGNSTNDKQLQSLAVEKECETSSDESSQSGDEDQRPHHAPAKTPTPNKPTRRLLPLRELTLSRAGECHRGRTRTTGTKARAPAAVRQREPQPVGSDISFFGEAPSRSASVGIKLLPFDTAQHAKDYTGGHRGSSR